MEQAVNLTAEIAGTDLRDEVVMLGAHFDTWHASPNASDNTSGVAVALEAMRILKAVGAKPRRTIRVALWSGEEQGLFGSRAYVARHFGDQRNPQARIRPALGVLQPGLRIGPVPRHLPAGQRVGAQHADGMDGAVPRPRHDDGVEPERREHRSHRVRRGRPAGVPVPAGPDTRDRAVTPISTSWTRSRPTT